MLLFSSVIFWTHDHEAILCREVVNVNPYTTKKGSTQRSRMWEKIAENLNKFTVPKFRVDKRSVRDHVGILVYKHKKKLLAEEKVFQSPNIFFITRQNIPFLPMAALILIYNSSWCSASSRASK